MINEDCKLSFGTYIEQILTENGIESYLTKIQGDNLEAEDIIKIALSDDTSEPKFTGKGKNKIG